MVKAACIKFLYSFVDFIEPSQVIEYANFLKQFMQAESTVLQMYTAAAIEKFLLKKDPETKLCILNKTTTPVEVITPLISGLLMHLKDE